MLRLILYWLVLVFTLGYVRMRLHDEEEDDVSPEPAPRRRPGRAPLPEVPSHYDSHADHLAHELQYVDLLARAQACRWYLTVGQHKPADNWGMVTINPAEVEAFLHSSYVNFGELPSAMRKRVKRYWQRALRFRKAVRAARDAPGSVELRLVELKNRLGLAERDVDAVLVALLPALDSRYRRLFAILQDDGTLTQPTPDLIAQMLRPLFDTGAQARAALDRDGPLWRQHIFSFADETAVERPLLTRPIHLDERIVRFVLDDRRPSRRGTMEQAFAQQADDAAPPSAHIDERLTDILSGPLAPLSPDELIFAPEIIEKIRRLAAVSGEGAPGNSREDARPVGAVFLYGPYGVGRLATARVLSGGLDRPMLVADASRALEHQDRWRWTVDLCYREARLLGASLFWCNVDRLDQTELPAALRDYLLEKAEREAELGGRREPMLTFFSGHATWDPRGRFRESGFVRFRLRMPSVAVRRRLWGGLLPAAAEFIDLDEEGRAELARILADAFQITAGQMRDAVAAARDLARCDHADDPRIKVAEIEAGCRRQAGRRLNTLATHVAPRDGIGFDDIILPESAKKQLRELSFRVQHRASVFAAYGFDQRHRLGSGLLTLFTGASGTGKTMAAEILASKNALDLYRIDMSQIVSKYVGETEKNLSRVFSEATDSNAILFFDEADSLFGKRGEVKDAQDRWANQEVNYLLQRIEEFAGVVILATNLQQNIDSAFLRRIHVILDFPFPGPVFRLQIWKRTLTTESCNGSDEAASAEQSPLPSPGQQSGEQEPKENESAIHDLSEEDLDFMAERFELAGGNIRNVVIDAAFRAFHAARERALEKTSQGDTVAETPTDAAGDELAGPAKITLDHILISTAREYQKLGKPINPGDFGRDYLNKIMENLYPSDDAAADRTPGA